MCPTLCNPMDCSPPDSSDHGISQARILEFVAISFSRSRDASPIQGSSSHLCIKGGFFTTESPGEPKKLRWIDTYKIHAYWVNTENTKIIKKKITTLVLRDINSTRFSGHSSFFFFFLPHVGKYKVEFTLCIFLLKYDYFPALLVVPWNGYVHHQIAKQLYFIISNCLQFKRNANEHPCV